MTPHAPRFLLAPRGPEVSRLALGWWRLHTDADAADPARLARKIEACLDLGVTTFDHADIYGDYGNEALFGAALAQAPALRNRMEIVTKCGIALTSPARPHHRVKHYDTSRAHILRSVEESLRALRTDWIDVLLIHRPDPMMDADEVAGAFDALRQSGKVLHFGVSNFLPHQLELLQSRLDRPLVTNQIEASLLRTEPLWDGTLDQCQRLGIAPMAWSPLGGGRLFASEEPQSQRLRWMLGEIGAALGGVAPDVLALAWLLEHPSRIQPVLGTTSLDRVRGAVAALGVRLDRQHWFHLLAAAEGREVP